MNKILTGALLLLCSFSAAAQTPRDSIAFATAEWRTTDLGGGAECRYAQIDMFGSRQSISVATYPGRRFTTSIVHLDRRAESTSDLGKAAGAEIAVSNILYMEADGSASVYKDLPLRDEVLTAAEAARRIRATPMVHVTSKLQRQELVKANRFLDGKDYEDAFMSSAILEQINKVACLAEPLYHFRINPQSVTHRKIILKNLDEIEANYRMLQCTMKYGQKDAAYLQYAVMKGYFKKIMKNLPPEDRNDPKVQQTIDLIRKAETEVRQAGADTLRNKLHCAGVQGGTISERVHRLHPCPDLHGF